MAISVAYSGNTSQTSGGAELVIGNSGAAITVAGVYQLSLDCTLLANAATPDLLEVRIYLVPAAAGTERLADLHSLVGAQATAYWLSKPYGSPISVKFSVKQIQGTTRILPYAIWLY